MKLLKYFSGWSYMRWFQFVAALIMFGGAAYNMQALPVLVGAVFLYQAITNTGCCVSSACEVPSKQNKKEEES